MQSCQSNVEFISCGTGAPDAQDKNYKSQDLLNNRSNHRHRLQVFCVLGSILVPQQFHICGRDIFQQRVAEFMGVRGRLAMVAGDDYFMDDWEDRRN
jgi:hypothetical protein